MPNLRLLSQIESDREGNPVFVEPPEVALLEGGVVEFRFAGRSTRLTFNAAHDFMFRLAEFISEIEFVQDQSIIEKGV